MADISMRVHRSSVYETLIPQDQRQRFNEYYSDNKQARERLQQKLTAQLDMQGARFLVAEHNGRVIGYVGVCLESDELAIMKGLFVDIEQQGKGVGGDLLSRAIEGAKPRAVELKVLEGNIRARELYEKYGFEQVGVNEGKFFGVNEIVMRRSIDKK